MAGRPCIIVNSSQSIEEAYENVTEVDETIKGTVMGHLSVDFQGDIHFIACRCDWPDHPLVRPHTAQPINLRPPCCSVNIALLDLADVTALGIGHHHVISSLCGSYVQCWAPVVHCKTMHGDPHPCVCCRNFPILMMAWKIGPALAWWVLLIVLASIPPSARVRFGSRQPSLCV